MSARKREVESVVFACVQNVLVLHTESMVSTSAAMLLQGGLEGK